MSALKRVAALSCVGLIATTTACGSSKSASPVSGVPNVTIKVGGANAYSTLDPAAAYDQGSWQVYYNIYQGLFTYAPGGNKPTPDLATGDCQYSSDQLTATCDIRSDVKFSNGDPLDANAVKFSLDRVMKIKSNTGVWSLLSTIKSVDVASPTEVKIHLTAPDATLEDRLASGVASIVDPKVFGAGSAEAADFTDVVGSGRYKVDSVAFGDLGAGKQPTEVKLSLNPNYKGSASAPLNSAIDLKYYADQKGTKAALDSKDVDVVVQDLNAQDIVDMQNSQQLGSGLQVFQGPGGTVRLMSFNTLHGVFKNLAVRKAVAELIDRDQIADNAYKHTVTPAFSVMPPGIANEKESFSSYTAHKLTTAQVKTQLENANISVPVKFTLSYGKGDAAKEAEVQMIANQLNNSGLFQVTLQGFAGGFKEMSKKVLDPGTFQAFMVAWSADYLDADDYISPMVGGAPGTPGPLYNGWHSEAVNKLIGEGLTYTTRTAAQKIYQNVQDDIAAAVPVLPIWTNSQFAAAQSNITGVPLTLDSSGTARWWMIGKNG